MTESQGTREWLTSALAAELRAESARKLVRQVAVANAIGVAQSTVSERWRGLTPLTVDQFVAWCRLLGESPSALLDRVLARRGVDASDNVVALLPDPGSGEPHPGLGSVTRWPEDAAAAETRDGSDEADYDA